MEPEDNTNNESTTMTDCQVQTPFHKYEPYSLTCSKQYAMEAKTQLNENNNIIEEEDFSNEPKSDNNENNCCDEQINKPKDQLNENNNILQGDKEDLNSEAITPPSHHARRPMNAFLIFCKRHRTVVREKYPTLENRAVTKILGEWWAGLEESDKACYTDLAKQYKDAFFNANPDFKWYKLPAPPLRTLNTRPTNYIQSHSSTEYEYYNDMTEEDQFTNVSGFTPGKLADETQLGNLSSLINPNFSSTPYNGSQFESPIVTQTEPVLPTPPKKRYVPANTGDAKSVSRKIFEAEPFENLRNHALSIQKECSDDETKADNMTQQELIDRIVDRSMEADEDTRKSVRSCKGKRYAEFMKGRLVVNKRTKKIPKTYKKVKQKIIDNNSNYSINLNYTIQKLSSRTNSLPESPCFRKRTYSEASDDSITKKMFRASDFNLDEKIEALPSLSLEKFQQRKKDSKKRRKIMPKLTKGDKVENLIGSRKRKARKESITHVVPQSPDLFNLATLAEVAVKLGQN